jgi:ankyrin repeat protein
MAKIPSSLKRRLQNPEFFERSGNEGSDPNNLEFAQCLLLQAAYDGDTDLVKELLEDGVSLEAADKTTGMRALHLAVGCNHLDLARFLVERGASFVPDKRGRMPTTIAALCEVSEELCDFIVEAEAAAEARAEGV